MRAAAPRCPRRHPDTEAKVHKAFATLGTVPRSQLETLAGDGSLSLTLDVKVAETTRELAFTIETDTRTYLVMP